MQIILGAELKTKKIDILVDPIRFLVNDVVRSLRLKYDVLLCQDIYIERLNGGNYRPCILSSEEIDRRESQKLMDEWIDKNINHDLKISSNELMKIFNDNKAL